MPQSPKPARRARIAPSCIRQGLTTSTSSPPRPLILRHVLSCRVSPTLGSARRDVDLDANTLAVEPHRRIALDLRILLIEIDVASCSTDFRESPSREISD